MKHLFGIAICLLVAAPAVAADKHDLSGTTFEVAPDYPKYDHALFIFRDAKDELWASHFVGRATAKSVIKIGKGNVPSTGFAVASTAGNQTKGRQDRRVLGELVRDGNAPQIEFLIDRIGSKQSQEKGRTDFSFRGTLVVAGESTDVSGTLTCRGSRTDRHPKYIMQANFEIRGRDIGLENKEDVTIRCAISTSAQPPGGKRKRR